MELKPPPREPHRVPTGYEVYRWPEFVALAKRLGIPLGLPTTSLTITLMVDQEAPVEVAHSYRACQPEPGDQQPLDPRPEYRPEYLKPMTAEVAAKARADWDAAAAKLRAAQDAHRRYGTPAQRGSN